MKLNYSVVIADTSCLILLDKIDELDILNALFEEVYITETIAKEFGKKLPQWINIENLRDQNYKQALEIEIDEGEASALALYFDLPNAILILDDYKARKTAEKLNMKYTGTFGILLRAKKMGVINELKPITDKIKATNFRFSDKLFFLLLKKAGEI
jgi:hypothetical protein